MIAFVILYLAIGIGCAYYLLKDEIRDAHSNSQLEYSYGGVIFAVGVLTIGWPFFLRYVWREFRTRRKKPRP